jgi:hypothetical protein
MNAMALDGQLCCCAVILGHRWSVTASWFTSDKTCGDPPLDREQKKAPDMPGLQGLRKHLERKPPRQPDDIQNRESRNPKNCGYSF